MTDFKIDNLSYTNKDFDAIYEELLTLGDEISAKWKPSQTNESDPGIVLIKENAIIGDKVNYNIDKNILEAFPSSVTQEGVARQLFEEQLACPANWYITPSGVINFRYIGTDNQTTEGLYEARAIIPQWTTVRDEDSSVTYTIIDFGKFITFDGLISETGYRVLQGTPNEYTYGGSNTITFGALKNNRLYFQEYNVAQNGIFVANVDDEHNYWKRVDLLSTQEYGSLVYRFGVDKNRQCYIEFPSWASDIIKNGIYVNYITTKGEDGNVASNILTKFANDVTVTPENEGYTFEDITLNSDNVFMRNVSAIVNGKNPDTIEQMYNNFKKTAGTFNTLVTLRDYNSKLKDLGEDVSNGFVCDRTNDIQSSYNIIHTQGNYTRRIMKEEVVEEPYALKLYMTQYVNAVNSPQNFNDTFNFIDNFKEETLDDGEEFEEVIDNSVYEVIDDLEEYKCMSHDFETLVRYKPLFFKNKYPINCSIIPRYKLSVEQMVEVKNNVISALYNLLKANNVEFGKGINYDVVYETILNADNRISNIALEDIQYKTYAVYRGSKIVDGIDEEDKYWEVPVNTLFEPMGDMSVEDASELGGKMYIGTYDSTNRTFQSIDTSISPIDGYVPEYNELININNTNDFDKYIGSGEFIIPPDMHPDYHLTTIERYGGTSNGGINYPFSTAFATDIYAKSVLNGNTPIVKADKTFSRSIKQSVEGEYEANYITTESVIDKTDIYSPAQYTVRDNESIQVFSPSYETEITFGIGVKLSYEINEDIPANQDYILGSGEYVYVFRKLEGQQDYQWKKYVEGDIIRVSKTLYKDSSALAIAPQSGIYDMSSGKTCGPAVTDILVGSLGTTVDKYFQSAPSIAMYSADRTTYDNITSLSQFINKCMIFSQDCLSGSDTFEKRREIKKELDSNYVYFWVLNNFTPDASFDSGYKCVLFAENQATRTLLNNEALFYASKDGSAIGTLGAGTKITRDVSEWNSEWACDRINIVDFYNYSIEERSKVWVKIEGTNIVTAYEQNITSFGKDSIVWLDGAELDYDIDNNEQSLYVSDSPVEVHYISQDGEYNDITLPTPKGSTIRSAMQLVSSDTQAQEILSGQSVSITDGMGTATISFSNEGYILTNRPCDYNGIDVDVRLVTLSNDYAPLGIMYYKKIATPQGQESYIENINDGITFEVDSLGTPITFDVKFTKGNYLIPFRYSGGSTYPSFEIALHDGTTPAIADISGSTTFEQGKMYYLDIGISELNEGYDSTITITGDASQIIELNKMIKYDMPEALKQEESQTYNGKSYYWYIVMQRIKELDQDNEFDYGYEILDSERIDNPLEASSFNNPAHIMNQFTICEMDIDAMKKDNVSMGSIRILNNVRS